MSNLYFIENMGCDDSTHGLARISDEDFPKFKEIIENLNKNSRYGCMPTIEVYRINENDVREVSYNPNSEWGDPDYIDPDDVFYMDGKTYTLAEGVYEGEIYRNREKVI